MDAIDLEETTTPPGWFVPRFDLWDEINGMILTCRFLEWDSNDFGTAVYLGEVDAGCYGHIPVSTVFAREVPACLVFNCTVSLDPGTQTFEATFTTLAGNEMLSVWDDLPGIFTVDHLRDYIEEAAARKGVLQSRNQSIRLLLNSEAVELPPDAVLWCDTSPCGWLERET